MMGTMNPGRHSQALISLASLEFQIKISNKQRCPSTNSFPDNILYEIDSQLREYVTYELAELDIKVQNIQLCHRKKG